MIRTLAAAAIKILAITTTETVSNRLTESALDRATKIREESKLNGALKLSQIVGGKVLNPDPRAVPLSSIPSKNVDVAVAAYLKQNAPKLFESIAQKV